MAAAFAQRGYVLKGFDAKVRSTVLPGSGLSSSAAFEVLIGRILNGLFADNAVSAIEIAQIGQYAENVYYGKPSGLMDQMASSVGGLVFIDFNDPKTPIVEKVDYDFAHSGYIIYYFVQYDRGILNEILGWFGRAPVDWLADAGRARFIITIMNSWQYCGTSMVMYLAGLQSIPALYYEAADIDGASTFEKFRYVTLPLLIPAIASAVIINLIGSLKLNDIIISLTNGGPAQQTHSLSTYISYVYFRIEKAGYASAIGVFMFVFILIVTIIANRYFRSKEVEY